MALNAARGRMLVKTLFLSAVLRTWERAQGSFTRASPWKHVFFSHHYRFFIISFILSPLRGLTESSVLRAAPLFHPWSALMDAGGTKLSVQSASTSLCLHLNICYSPLLSLPSFLMHCASKWNCCLSNASFLSSEMQLACNYWSRPL